MMKEKVTKPLLITTIFGPSKHNKQWYKLQKNFIGRNTTVQYEYKIVLNSVSSNGFEPEDILCENKKNLGHLAGLRQILSYCREHAYHDYLILDSDAFPIFRGWQKILIEQMNSYGKTIAAPIRTENLDLFPHPSVVFIRGDSIHNPSLDFRRGVSQQNMLGIDVSDVGSVMQGCSDVLPLVRTNRLNYHPVAAAIYNHLFYHHGAGSRGFRFRVCDEYSYYAHWLGNNKEEQGNAELFDSLFQDPLGFIKTLTDPPHVRKSLINRILWKN